MVLFCVRPQDEPAEGYTWSVDPGTGPVSEGRLSAAAERAAELWNRSGAPPFTAGAGSPAPIRIAWRIGSHGACRPFGIDTAVAHTGQGPEGWFLHLDAERAWDTPSGPALDVVLAHEFGHVLGLDHSPDPRALLFPAWEGKTLALGVSDLAGLHSLHGGGADAPGDLHILTEGGQPKGLSLRLVAPPGRSRWGVFDLDGDGSQELFVFRADVPSSETLMIYHFAPGPRLERTAGPVFGFSVPDQPLHLVRDRNQPARLIVQLDGSGRYSAHEFDRAGNLVAPSSSTFAFPDGPCDLDGDGHLDDPDLRGTVLAPQGALPCDLDGDGVFELVASRAQLER